MRLCILIPQAHLLLQLEFREEHTPLTLPSSKTNCTPINKHHSQYRNKQIILIHINDEDPTLMSNKIWRDAVKSSTKNPNLAKRQPLANSGNYFTSYHPRYKLSLVVPAKNPVYIGGNNEDLPCVIQNSRKNPKEAKMDFHRARSNYDMRNTLDTHYFSIAGSKL